MDVGDIIKKIRYESDLNQTQIADILKCSQVSVSRIKRGLQFPNTSLLLKIVKLANKHNIKVAFEELLPKE